MITIENMAYFLIGVIVGFFIFKGLLWILIKINNK